MAGGGEGSGSGSGGCEVPPGQPGLVWEGESEEGVELGLEGGGGGQPLGQFGQPGSQFGQSSTQFGQSSSSQFGTLGQLSSLHHGGPQMGLLTTVPGTLGRRPIVAPKPLYPSDLQSDSSQISAEF